MPRLTTNQVDSSRLEPRPSLFNPVYHPRMENAIKNVDQFFLQNWPFESQKAKKKFVAAGFSRVTCLYFPKARDDRIEPVCKLLSILFLIDDQLEQMSLEEGELYNSRLMPLCKGTSRPHLSVPVEWIMYDLWSEMRACNQDLANDVLEPMFTFMRAQTSRERLNIQTLDHYLVYRQGDVGQALLASLTRFSMGLALSPATLETVAPIEDNCGRHISIVNDILSYEKELLSAQNAHLEGGALCNAVDILAREVRIDISSAKRVLWALVREWEVRHEAMVRERAASDDCGNDLREYLKGLEFHMSGNEAWSRSTKRYQNVQA